MRSNKWLVIVVLAVVAFLFKDKLKPLFEQVKNIFTNKKDDLVNDKIPPVENK